MRKIFKISLLFILIGVGSSLSQYTMADSGLHKSSQGIDQRAGETFTDSQHLPLFFAEFQTESGSEIEPKVCSGSAQFPKNNPSHTGNEYLKISKEVELSTANWERLFPFHSHL